MLSFKRGEPEKEVVIWQFLKAVRVATKLGLWRRGSVLSAGQRWMCTLPAAESWKILCAVNVDIP